MRDIVKCFPGVRANSKVCFDVTAGEVHALLGENGAGKSTLMRQLYGLYQPDEGDIIIDGKRLTFRSPADAIKAGIGMIHQHFMLVPTLTVAQNVALGQRSSRGPLLDLKRVTVRINELSEEYGLRVDPRAYVWQLSVGEQQRVEIMKTLYRGARLIILDEPTAVLTPQEVKDLFATLRRMVKEGHSLVFISHKLQEVMAISDRVTVLRDGKVIGTRTTSEVTRSELVQMMVGRELNPLTPRPREPGPPRLAVTGLHDFLTVAVSLWLTKNAADPARVKFVEMPPGTMLPALAAKRIDAAVSYEPFLSSALGTGAKVFGKPFDAVGTGFISGAWFALGPWANAHRDAVIRFARILDQASQYADAHYDDLIPLIATFSKLPPETLHQMVPDHVPPTLTATAVQPVIDAAARAHEIAAPFPAAEMIFPGVP